MRGWNGVVAPCRQARSRHAVEAVVPQGKDDRESLITGWAEAEVDVHPAGDAPRRAVHRLLAHIGDAWGPPARAGASEPPCQS